MMMPRPHGRSRRAFTLIDSAVATAVLGALAVLVLPTLGESRRSAQIQFCQARLGGIGAGSAQFALAHNGLFAGLLAEQSGRGTTGAHVAEALAILRSRGRPDIPGSISGWLPDVGVWSLSLVEFQDRALADPFNICPSHDLLNKWRRWPQAFDQGALLPRQPTPSETSKRYPYYSSYHLTGGAFDRNQNVPGGTSSPQVLSRLYQNGNPHGTYTVPGTHNLGPSLSASVAFPAQKVHAFEEHQRHFPGLDLYFMYDNARANALFFDGSVRAPISGNARPTWNPNFPEVMQETGVVYSPRAWEPPIQGPSPNPAFETVADSYRWTRDGLLGWDYLK